SLSSFGRRFSPARGDADGAAGSWLEETAPSPARCRFGAAIAAAAASARAASTVPWPEPAAVPPGGPVAAPPISPPVTWAGVRSGNFDLISATMPVTTALAALGLLTGAEVVGGTSAITPPPA